MRIRSIVLTLTVLVALAAGAGEWFQSAARSAEPPTESELLEHARSDDRWDYLKRKAVDSLCVWQGWPKG